jgi:hypothetical protein
MSRRAARFILLIAAASVLGCQKDAPPIDLSKAPWLDPKAQMEGLKNSDFRIRGISAFNLGNIGAKAAEALPELERIAGNDPEPKVRENAREAIEKIKAAAAEVEP